MRLCIETEREVNGKMRLGVRGGRKKKEVYMKVMGGRTWNVGAENEERWMYRHTDRVRRNGREI